MLSSKNDAAHHGQNSQVVSSFFQSTDCLIQDAHTPNPHNGAFLGGALNLYAHIYLLKTIIHCLFNISGCLKDIWIPIAGGVGSNYYYKSMH